MAGSLAELRGVRADLVDAMSRMQTRLDQVDGMIAAMESARPVSHITFVEMPLQRFNPSLPAPDAASNVVAAATDDDPVAEKDAADRDALFVTLWNQHATYGEIARQTGLGYGKIPEARDRLGLKPRPRRMRVA